MFCIVVYSLTMDIITTILSAAKVAGVSGTLLLAICSHESAGFTQNYAPMDKGTPSFGSCQIKFSTASALGFKGNPEELNKPEVNAKYAAFYLKHQQGRYGNDWVKLVSSYNAGSYRESSVVMNCPRNLKYVRLVQERLPDNMKNRLDCGNEELADNP